MTPSVNFSFPKLIFEKFSTDLLVNFSRELVQNRLVSSLYKESLFEDLLFEDEGLTAERDRVRLLLKAYKEAFQTLNEVL